MLICTNPSPTTPGEMCGGILGPGIKRGPVWMHPCPKCKGECATLPEPAMEIPPPPPAVRGLPDPKPRRDTE